MSQSITTIPVQSPVDTKNNFDAIRIVAALVVLYSHHFALTGKMEPAFFGVHTLGGMAVIVFFVISGYLVAGSWYRDPSPFRFAARRFLRIWPALTFTVIITIVFLGSSLTNLSPSEYFLHPQTREYVKILWMKIQYTLPGVFESNPYPRGVNGSLWTIPIEVRCYIAIFLTGTLLILKRKGVFLTVIALYFIWFLFKKNPDITGTPHYGSELSAFFLIGAALFALEIHWKKHTRNWLISSAVLGTIAWLAGFQHTSLLITLPIFIIYAGSRETRLIKSAGAWGDPSYGIYLFAFPIQQTTIALSLPNFDFWTTFFVSTGSTIALAYISWHAIEKQALKIKPRTQNRGKQEN